MAFELAKVWFRSDDANWKSMKAYQDVGSLTVDADRLRFVSAERDISVPLASVRSVAQKRIGRDFVNKWVCVEYQDGGETRRLYLVDGGRIGWSGMLGGNKTLFEAVRGHVDAARTGGA